MKKPYERPSEPRATSFIGPRAEYFTKEEREEMAAYVEAARTRMCTPRGAGPITNPDIYERTTRDRAGPISDDMVRDAARTGNTGLLDWMAERVNEGKHVVVLTPEEFRGYQIMKDKEERERAPERGSGRT